MENNTILFFGCGTHREAKMMSFIIGRKFKTGIPATLRDFSLGIQSLDKTPDTNISEDHTHVSVRSILHKNWGETFKNYIAKPDPGKYVQGVLWEITPAELEIIRYWELVDFGWYDERQVTVRTETGDQLQATTVCLREGHDIDALAHPVAYDPWLQSPERYKVVAHESRQLYFQASGQ